MLRRQLVAVAAFALISSGAAAQDTVKIGLILPMTGQQASTGKQIAAAVKLYITQHGIRWTGMPAWNKTLSEQQIWTVVTFLSRVEKLPPAATKVFELPTPAPGLATANPNAR